MSKIKQPTIPGPFVYNGTAVYFTSPLGDEILVAETTTSPERHASMLNFAFAKGFEMEYAAVATGRPMPVDEDGTGRGKNSPRAGGSIPIERECDRCGDKMRQAVSTQTDFCSGCGKAYNRARTAKLKELTGKEKSAEIAKAATAEQKALANEEARKARVEYGHARKGGLPMNEALRKAVPAR